MNIRDLQYLVTVAECQHFGKAAERCFVSQPTLSAQLKKLEEELGILIFERTNKKVLITPRGQAVIEQAQIILNQIQRLREIAEYNADPLAGEFRLGSIPTLGPYLFPHILPAIKKNLPNLKIYLTEDKTDSILQQLKQGRLDAVILALPIAHAGCETQELFNEPFYLALPKQHKLADKKRFSLSDLADQEILLLEDGHCLREQALQICQLSGAFESCKYRATSLETLRNMVNVGNGMTLLPGLAIQYETRKNSPIKIRHFPKPMPSRLNAMLWRNNSSRQLCCKQMVNIIRDIIPAVLAEKHKLLGQ